jgi:hypothetical protein
VGGLKKRGIFGLIVVKDGIEEEKIDAEQLL